MKNILKQLEKSIKNKSKSVNIDSINYRFTSRMIINNNTYINYIKKYLDTNNCDYNLINNLFTDSDKNLLCNNCLYMLDIEKTRLKAKHNLDCRQPEELLLNLLINDINEKMTIIEANNHNINIKLNENASHVDLKTQNSEPDLIIDIDNKLIYLEQQTCSKLYTHTYIKEHKILKLRKMTENEDKIIFILQKIIKNNDCYYAIINVNDEFDICNYKMSNNSFKNILQSTDILEYFKIDEIIDIIKNKL